VQKWHPVDGSLDEIGANGLWRNRPSASDILAACDKNDGIVLHCILESGSNPAGQGEDFLFLGDADLLSRIAVLGIEPIVFPDDDTLKVSDDDGVSVKKLVEKAKQSMFNIEGNPGDKLLVLTPDRLANEDVLPTQQVQSTEIVVRDGAHGSFIHHQQRIPSATL